MYEVVSTGTLAITNTVWNSGLSLSSPFGNNYGVGTYGAEATVSGTGASVTGTIVSFDVTGVAGDVLTINDIYGGALASVVSYLGGASTSLAGVNIPLLPEPMTMALLGLGGLFVRRRNA